jgi:hypothetical protein
MALARERTIHRRWLLRLAGEPGATVSEHQDSYNVSPPGEIDFAGLVRRIKLVAPVPLPDALPLPGVAARLAQASTYPVTLVTAPAGFGKTTQLALWQRTVPDTAWIALSP